jgi:hypothetical protein
VLVQAPRDRAATTTTTMQRNRFTYTQDTPR